MNERAGKMALLDWRIEHFLLPSADGLDEILEMGFFAAPARPRLLIVAEPRAVPVVAIHRHDAFRTVENIPNGVVVSGVGAELGLARLGFRRGKTGGGNVSFEVALADAGFVVGDPVPDLEFQHFAFPVGHVELAGDV